MRSNLPLSFTVGLAFVTCFTAGAQDKPMAPDEAQIRSWIAALANPGPQRRFQSPNERLTGEERENLRPVITAYANLSKHFVEALPYLVQSSNDKRFSYPQEHPSSGFFENQSVGDACRNIIQRKVFLSYPVVIDSRDIAVSAHLPIGKEWYSRVKEMSLFEMQVDALDWILKQPPPDRVSREQWNESMMKVKAFREEFEIKRMAEDRILFPPIEGK
jgi:hypothetical protein